jgi:hypothetical protein
VCACAEKLQNSVSITAFYFSDEKIENESNAVMLCNFFAEIIELMSNAEILDWSIVHSATNVTDHLAFNYPQVAIPMLKSLGVAGRKIKQSNSYLTRDLNNFLETEIMRSINRLESKGLLKREHKTKGSLTVRNARKTKSENK